MPQQQRIAIPLVGETSVSNDVQVDNQETLNLMVGVMGEGARAPAVLKSVPGLLELGAIGDGGCRSPLLVSWTAPGRSGRELYGVWGSKLMRVSPSAGTAEIGTLGTSSGRVRIARGRRALLIVDGQNGYTYDGTTFGQVTDLDFPKAIGGGAPTHAVYIDGYFVINDAATDNFHISALEDPTNWNGLDFEAAAVAPDNALAISATESELWIIGDETSQAYYNSGNPFFPFSVILPATQEVGIAAPQSIAESDAGIFFLATTPEGGLFVYRLSGQQGQRVTRVQQEEYLETLGDVSDAWGFIYSQAGQSFYVLHLRDDLPTLVYNIRAGTWETRASAGGAAWRVGGTGILDRQLIAGSRLNALFYEVSLKAYTDGDAQLTRRRRTQVVHNLNHRLDWHEVDVVCQAGVGLPTGVGSDPEIRLRYSDDGGVTWSDPLDEPLGREGERQQTARWYGLGQSRARIYELEVSDPVPWTVVSMQARVEVLED